MRERYGTLFDRFWDGPTGRDIQGRGKDAVIVAVYLLSNKHANMLGLYELPIVTMAHYLPVIEPVADLRVGAITRALQALRAVGFADYDPGSSFVWVREMARIQLLLEPGERLDRRDNRIPAIAKLYASLKPNSFLDPFFARYAKDLHLRPRREALRSPLEGASETSPLEGASEGLGRGFEGGAQAPPKPETVNSKQKQVPETGTETGTSNQEQRARTARATNGRSGNVFTGRRTHVPQSLHQQLLRAHPPSAEADAELRRWYAEVDRDYTTGTHAHASINPEMFAFWKERHTEQWPAEAAVKPRAGMRTTGNVEALQAFAERGQK